MDGRASVDSTSSLITRRRALLTLGGAALGLAAGIAGSPRALAEPASWCQLGGVRSRPLHQRARADVFGTEDAIGAWGPPFRPAKGVVAVHAVLMPTGRVLMLRKSKKVCVWDPVTGDTQETDAPTETNLFCGGQTVLADGGVLFAGGTITNTQGGRWVYRFDPETLAWERQDDMRRGRWYPTVTALADGRALITSGYTENGSDEHNIDVEVYDDGSITFVGEQALGNYPHQFVLPDGTVLVAGPNKSDAWVFDLQTDAWSPAPNLSKIHTLGSAVLMPGTPEGSSTVMVIGGTQRTQCELLDASTMAVWQQVALLPQVRSSLNVVILPDGTLLAIGGENDTDGALFDAQLYDPAADTWTQMAAQALQRKYHSTALLLPDGRVLSAGDWDVEDGGYDYCEIYEPPYLFRGHRPVITSAPATITWGASYTVGTADVVHRAVLMGLGATTHANDMNQRHVELRFETTSGGIRIDAPPSAGVAPPGFYMLFLLSAGGVPSVAKMVHLS